MDDPQKPPDDEDEYVPGEFSDLDDPDYDLERARLAEERARRPIPRMMLSGVKSNAPTVVPGTPAPSPLAKKPDPESS
jgi:hypothetical protein